MDRNPAPLQTGHGVEFMQPKTLILAFGGLVSLVVLGSVLMVVLTVAQ
ncbi:hypothetical protein [Pseudosulfitobacter koreensis]|uniref:Uncharacterized protein n=1 Tax=Pseudosulfitobacter koreensis TaxID=2968472 RepID=A0ABT1YX26_9RHOB|nr:hypothetical protein [Pseudosulfitobacter koreense]MCR8825438.1 hypothetical protein [Pseudosulfitobacter koreense]